jgi:hypothetical protein
MLKRYSWLEIVFMGVSLIILFPGNNLYGEEKISIDMEKYRIETPHFITVISQEKKIIGIGYMGVSPKDTTKKSIHVTSEPLYRIMKETEEDGNKVLSWEGGLPELGLSYQAKLILQSNKLIWITTYDCEKDLPYSIHIYPLLFHQNPEVFLGAKYELTDINGKEYRGEIPEKPEKFMCWPRGISLKEMVLHTKIGKITFRLSSESYQGEQFDIRIMPKKDGSCDNIRLNLIQFARERLIVAGFSNQVKVEIEFE